MNLDGLYHNCRTGDPTAEEHLFRHLTARFRLFAEHKVRNRLDAEEVVQNALAVVVSKYKSIEFTVSFAAWAHKVLNNEILRYYRAKKYRENLFMSDADIAPVSERWSPEADTKRHLLDCMKKLCSSHIRYARALNLKFQGYEARAICRRLGVTVDNFYVILSRARSLLKLCLENGDIA